MKILETFVQYKDAEDYADRYAGDTRTEGVKVVQDFAPTTFRARFLVVTGPVPAPESLDKPARFEVQYDAS